MPKLVLNDIASLANTASAKEALNDNFTAIEEAIENTISRDGTQPNQMGGDIDMNGNDLLNVNKIDAAQYYKNGIPLEQSVAYADKHYQILSGDGVTTGFVLDADPGSLGNLRVSISGIVQKPGDDYSFSGTTLTFVTAPPNALRNIFVVYDVALPTGVTDASAVLFTQSGSGVVVRTMQDKLREVELSITDFGADPLGVAACDTAWAAAQTALFLLSPEGGTIAFPRGVYRFTSTIQVGNNTTGVPSTLNGVKIRGAGWGRTATTMNANRAATRLVYDGTVGGTLLHIKGPISGICVEDLMLDGNDKAATLVHTQRSFHQSVRRVLGVKWTNGYALVIDANNANTGYGGAAPISHVYEQFDLQNPGVDANSVDIANGAGNVNQLLFLRCYLDRYNTTATVGLRLGYCDHIQLIGCHIAQTGASGSTGIAIQVRPQAGLGAFPWNITLTGTAMAGGVAYDSSLQAWTNTTYPALIFQPFYTADGAPLPPASANAGPTLPQGMCRGFADTGAHIGPDVMPSVETVASAATIAPVKRVVLLTGSTPIATITPPPTVTGMGTVKLTLIHSGAGLPLLDSGNIAVPTFLQNYRAMDIYFSTDTGKWHQVEPPKLMNSVVYDPPSLADGTGATTTVAVTGAVMGDVALAGFDKDLQGILVTASVSAADTVAVRFQNETGGVIDLASGTLNVRVLK